MFDPDDDRHDRGWTGARTGRTHTHNASGYIENVEFNMVHSKSRTDFFIKDACDASLQFHRFIHHRHSPFGANPLFGGPLRYRDAVVRRVDRPRKTALYLAA